MIRELGLIHGMYRHLSLLHSNRSVSGYHPDTCLMGILGALSTGLNRWSVKLTTQLYLVLRLRIHILMARCSIRDKGNFTSTLTNNLKS